MRRILPLASGLVLALVASTAFAADAPARRSSRTDLLAAHRQAVTDLQVRRTDDRARAGLDDERLVLGRTAAPVVSLPEVPPTMGVMGFGDDVLTVSRGSILDVEGLDRRSPRGNWVLHGVRIDDDPAVQRALEGRAARLPSLIALGVNDVGTERLFQLR